MTDKPIEEMLVKELKDELRKRGLKVSGKKAELQNRLREAISEEGPSKRPSPRKKSPKKKTPRKKSPDTPSVKASDQEEGTIMEGRNKINYEVAVNKAGKKFWRKCTAKTASEACKIAEQEKEEAEIDVEEWNRLQAMKVAELKKAAKKKDPKYEEKYGKRLVKWQLMMFLLTGDPGPKPPKGTSPRRKKVPTKPKRRPSPPPKSRKEKEPVEEEEEEEEEEEIKIPAKTNHIGEVALDGWTVVGELDPLFSFLKSFSNIEDLISKIEKAKFPKGSENIVRLEPDPNCDIETGTCGAQALGIFIESGSYDLFAEFTTAKYLKQLYVGPYTLLKKAKTKADFGLLKTLVVGNLEDFKALVDKYESSSDLLEDMGREVVDGNVVILSNPSTAKRTNLMNVRLALDGKGVYRGIHITRS